VTPSLLVLLQLIYRRLASFAGELQESVLMQFLASIQGQPKVADRIEPLDMPE